MDLREAPAPGRGAPPPRGPDAIDRASRRLSTAGCGPACQSSLLADCPFCGRSAAGRAARDSRLFPPMLVLVTALGPLSMSSFIPAIPAIQSDFAVSEAVAQLTLSVSIWTMAVFSLLYGVLADRYGRRPVLLAGVGLAIAGSALSAVAPHIALVIVGRALQAAGATSGFVLARVIVRDVYGDARAASVLGYVTAAMTLAPLVGPIAGGVLIESSGWRSVFVAVGLAALALLALLALRLPETRPADAPHAPSSLHPATFLALLRDPSYRRYVVFGAMAQGTFMAFLAGAPYVVTVHFDLPATAYGIYFMGIPIGFSLGSLVAGRYGERIGHERLLSVGAAGAVAACLAALWASTTAGFTPWGLFLPAAAIAVANGLALPGAQIGMLAAAGDRQGAASGLFGFTQLFSSGVLAQAVGLLLVFGPAAVTTVMTASAAVGFLTVIAGPRRRLAPEGSL